MAPGLLAGLGLLVFLLFAGSLSNGFIDLDDNAYVLDNPNVTRGLTLQGIAWALTSVSYYYWQPVTWISHMIDCELFGLRPGGHHFTSVLLHSVNAILFLLAAFRLTGNRERSLIAAGLFALHPLRVESVAWIAERKDLLSGMFFLMGILAYAAYARNPSRRRYVTVLLCYLLALASKPTSVTFPFVLLLIDYWPLKRLTPLGKAVKEKIPFFLMTAASAVLTFIGQRLYGAVVTQETVPLGLRLSNSLTAYVKYLGKFLWPHPLAVFYPYPTEIALWQPAAAVVLLGAITALAWRQRERPYLLTGWLWFLGTMVPMLGIVQVGLQSFADRFTYIPMMGLTLALVWLGGDLIPSESKRKWIVSAVMIALAALTWIQVGYWQGSLPLFSHTLQVAPHNPLIASNYGYALIQAGRAGDAIPHLEEAVKLAPRFVNAWINLGAAYSQRQRNDDAERALREALRLEPGASRPHAFVAIAAMAKGDDVEAMREFQEALKYPISDDLAAQSYNDLGMILAKQGKTEDAIPYFRKALEFRPGLVAAHRNLVTALLGQDRVDEAVRHLNYAIAVTKGDNELRKMLAGLMTGNPGR